MKKIMMIACCMMFSLISFAQPTDTKGVHTFTSPSQLKVCDITGTESGNLLPINKNWNFRIEKIVSNGYIIHFLQFPDSYTNAATLNSTYNKYAGTGTDIYFLLSPGEYKSSAAKFQPRASFTVGAATSIIKIRPGSKKLLDDKYPINFDFANDFSLGLLVGGKFNSKRPDARAAHNLLAGFGLTSVGVDSLTTRGFATSKANNSALYASVGYVFEYNKFQLGVFTGIDMMAGEVGKKWIYKDRPWIGVSIGFSIFKTQSTSNEQPK